jgi:hypothetical protein
VRFGVLFLVNLAFEADVRRSLSLRSKKTCSGHGSKCAQQDGEWFFQRRSSFVRSEKKKSSNRSEFSVAYFLSRAEFAIAYNVRKREDAYFRFP